MVNVTCIFLLLCLFSASVIIQSLVCKRQCIFLDLPNNSSFDISGCQNATGDDGTSKCSVYATINHKDNKISGRASMEQCGSTASSVTTILKQDSSMITTIKHSCSIDNCDTEFLQNLTDGFWPSNGLPRWSSSLLEDIYDKNSFGNDTSCDACADCSSSRTCEISHNSTDSEMEFPDLCDGKTRCYNLMKDDILLSIYLSCNSYITSTTNLVLRANRNVSTTPSVLNESLAAWRNSFSCEEIYVPINCVDPPTSGQSTLISCTMLTTLFHMLLLSILTLST